MKSRFTRPLTQVVLTSIVTIAVSVGCSASRLATSPGQATATPSTTTQSATPLVSSAVQDKPVCTLKISSAPVIKGLKLGMTPDEVLALFPGSRDDADLRSQLARPASQFSSSNFVIKPGKYENKAEFSGISQIVFTLLDGRVSGLTVHFNGPQWEHVDHFVAKLNESYDLSPADQWEAYVGLDNQMKTLSCTDFSIRVFAGGEGGNLNYVLIQDLEADKKLKERRKKARATATPG